MKMTEREREMKEYKKSIELFTRLYLECITFNNNKKIDNKICDEFLELIIDKSNTAAFSAYISEIKNRSSKP